jgi:ADP-heptose:LPS heptosyltransferase
METPARILIIRLTAIGDVVLTLPAVSILRQNFPAAKIAFLTTKENDSLLQGFRDVDETIALDRAAFRSWNPWRFGKELFGLIRRLRVGRFSLAVDLQGNGESAWLTRLTGAPQRWGVVHKPGRRYAFTHSVDRRRDIHAAEMHLELLRRCGLKTDVVRNEFFLPAEALAAAQNFFAANQLVPEKPTLFLQPFTSSLAKNWPLENFLAIAKHWEARGGQIIFGGGPADVAALEPARAAGFVISAGVPLLVTGGLMQLSTLTVGGDTGALHLAVAQGKRVVMIMNTNRPWRPHPFRHAEWALAPAVEWKIASINVGSVITACEEAQK